MVLTVLNFHMILTSKIHATEKLKRRKRWAGQRWAFPINMHQRTSLIHRSTQNSKISPLTWEFSSPSAWLPLSSLWKLILLLSSPFSSVLSIRIGMRHAHSKKRKTESLRWSNVTRVKIQNLHRIYFSKNNNHDLRSYYLEKNAKNHEQV